MPGSRGEGAVGTRCRGERAAVTLTKVADADLGARGRLCPSESLLHARRRTRRHKRSAFRALHRAHPRRRAEVRIPFPPPAKGGPDSHVLSEGTWRKGCQTQDDVWNVPTCLRQSPPPLEHDTWGAPHPKAAVVGPPARTAGFDPSPLLSFAFGTALPGRVGVWRSGGRPSIAVAAPFVWRCLTGSTVAPFPHPPGHRRWSPAPGSHRTWRADFPHQRSSEVGSQHCERLQLRVWEAQFRCQ
jgi:hypothetical protein